MGQQMHCVAGSTLEVMTRERPEGRRCPTAAGERDEVRWPYGTLFCWVCLFLSLRVTPSSNSGRARCQGWEALGTWRWTSDLFSRIFMVPMQVTMAARQGWSAGQTWRNLLFSAGEPHCPPIPPGSPRPGTVRLHLLSAPEDLGGDYKAGPPVDRREVESYGAGPQPPSPALRWPHRAGTTWVSLHR